jgi:hypothetical protein
MDANAFDRFTQLLATRATRRSTALGAAASLALIPGMRALAQDATPVTGTPEAVEDIDALYVQSFSSGEISDAGDGSFTLSLAGGTGQTVYFTDHPERLAGAVATDSFLDERSFDASNPPNAAMVADVGEGQTIVVFELLEPALDGSTHTVTYRAQPVTGELSGAMSSFQGVASDIPLGPVGPVSLFIDDLACASEGSFCKSNSQCCSGRCCESISLCPTATCLG